MVFKIAREPFQYRKLESFGVDLNERDLLKAMLPDVRIQTPDGDFAGLPDILPAHHPRHESVPSDIGKTGHIDRRGGVPFSERKLICNNCTVRIHRCERL